MASTALMNLDLPTPTVTLGPLYAQMNNDAFQVIDLHDHSSGKGAKVKPNGMDINADLDIQQNNLLNVLSLKLSPVGALLTGPTNTLKVYSYNGDLYYTNSAGATVQITSGGSIVSPSGNAQVFEVFDINSDLVINPSDDFVEIRVDTSVARLITLPLAANVAAGRIYIIKDKTGSALLNNITIAASGSDLIDGAATLVVDMNRAAFQLIGNGIDTWDIT